MLIIRWLHVYISVGLGATRAFHATVGSDHPPWLFHVDVWQQWVLEIECAQYFVDTASNWTGREFDHRYGRVVCETSRPGTTLWPAWTLRTRVALKCFSNVLVLCSDSVDTLDVSILWFACLACARSNHRRRLPSRTIRHENCSRFHSWSCTWRATKTNQKRTKWRTKDDGESDDKYKR